MPTEITSALHFHTLLTSHTYFIADFYATWCPPCKTIAPYYSQLSSMHSVPHKLAFVKVNVDEQEEVAAKYGITAMPTFLVFKGGEVIETIKGANVPALKRVVEMVGGKVKAESMREAEKEKEAEGKIQGDEEKTVSGSYGMTGGHSSWKMSLN
ncbi:thioredoxin-like protein [Lindgomyces ingoldianus]|uniref:Thioredoxin-like protein n=1 Tax=Lindgomyces ingoldianus TaxID=673940 RepID=A0ACB6QPA7_9PLEO|nr:thioredoxin-like protein [Lindgomyces ingoldianus]KAF2468823.1 thioredoxin-like protein [Lindgomyces ingoldianus]